MYAIRSYYENDYKIGILMPTKELRRWVNDGNLLKQELEAEGYEVSLEYANNDYDTQITQIENMIRNNFV